MLNGAVALLNLAQSGGDPTLSIQDMLSQAGVSIDPNTLQAIAGALTVVFTHCTHYLLVRLVQQVLERLWVSLGELVVVIRLYPLRHR